MNPTTLLTGFVLTIFWTARYILNKEARLRDCNPSEISFVISLWMLLGSIGIIFLLWESEFQPFFAQGRGAILPLSVSMLKGILLYLIVTSLAQISKNSISSGTFAMSSSLPISSIIVMLFFGEELSYFDIIAVLLIGLISFLYFLRGMTDKLTKEDKISYIALLVYVTLITVSDRVSGVNQSWAVHLTASTMVWLAMGYIKPFFNKSKEIINFSSLTKKPLIILGVTFLLSEILIIYSMQNIFSGVVMPSIFIRVSTPITMLVASLKYGEGKWQDQAVFGGLILVPTMMSILA